jgi:hypothetical protein
MPSSPYADGRLADERRPVAREVRCARCAAVVLAAKFSPQQTSVQWTAGAVRACAESALIDGCASLRASIDAAVRDGRLPVVSPVPEVAAPEVAAPEVAAPEVAAPEVAGR